MARVRKTYDEFEIQGDYGQGFELATTEVTLRAARDNLAAYRTNEPGIPFRLVTKRVKIAKAKKKE